MGLCNSSYKPTHRDNNQLIAILRAKSNSFHSFNNKIFKYYKLHTDELEELIKQKYIDYTDAIRYIYALNKYSGGYKLDELKYNSAEGEKAGILLGCWQTGATLTQRSKQQNPLSPIIQYGKTLPETTIYYTQQRPDTTIYPPQKRLEPIIIPSAPPRTLDRPPSYRDTVFSTY